MSAQPTNLRVLSIPFPILWKKELNKYLQNLLSKQKDLHNIDLNFGNNLKRYILFLSLDYKIKYL